MALEPFVQSNVYDLSGGLLPVPEDTGYNIVMPVYTPAGPLEKTKVASQKEFLDKFMTSTKLVPDDHISAQFAYSVLAINPVYVMRACPSTLLEGMTSEGNTWLFDQEYNIVPKYLKFDVDLSLKNASYSISLSNNTWESNEGESVGDFINGLLSSTADSNATANSLGILSADNSQIISRERLTSTNFGKWEESAKLNAFLEMSFSNGTIEGNNQYVSINGNSYEFLSDITGNTNESLPNNTAIYNTNSIWDGLCVLSKEQCLSSCKDIKFTLTGLTATAAHVPAASTTSELEILANVPIDAPSVGIFDDSSVKGTATSFDAAAVGKPNWFDYITNAAVGDKYLCYSTVSSPVFSYKAITAVEKDIGKETLWKDDNSYAQSKCNYKRFTKAGNESTQTSANPYPAKPTDPGTFALSNGGYMTVNDGGVAKYYNLNSSDYVVIGLDTGYAGQGTGFENGSIGQTGVRFNWASNAMNSVDIGPITYVAKAVDASATSVDISDLIYLKVTANQVDYYFFSTSDVINPAVNLEPVDNINNAWTRKVVILGNKYKSNVDFVTSVISQFVNADGGYREAQNYSIAVASGSTSTASLKLYIPSYGTAAVHIDGTTPPIELMADSDVGTAGKETFYYGINASKNDELIKFEKIQVQVGDTVYYVGESPAATRKAKLSNEPCDEATFKALLQRELAAAGICIYNGFFVSPDAGLTVQGLEQADNCQLDIIGPFEITQNAQECFAIVPKFPCTTNLFRFDYSYDNSTKIVSLFFNYKSGVATEEWTMSFVPGVVDGYGIDQWYTRVKSDYFQVVHLNDEATPLESLTGESFGGSISVPEYDDQYAIDAIKQITDYEDGIQYEIISDAGICSPNLASAIGSLTKDLWAVYPFSIPPYTKDKDVINYIGALGESCKQFECRAWAVADRMPVGTFSSVIPGSYKCIIKMVEASRSGSMEFAPIGGLNHGTVGVVNLVQDWKKKAREELLDYRVCTVKGGVTTPYYINQNYTMQPAKSYMLEEQNVRMTNAAIHVIQTLAVNYLHELNTKRLRDKVQENVNKAIQDRLFKGKAYTPAQYMAVCDDTNNPISIIEQNKLVISLYASFTPSIHYILIDHYIVSLDQINSSEG